MDSKGLVIVAVGLPGAGKSRFHEKFLPDAVRCCQDLLKRREKVEALVEETVRAGGIAYVDRTDLDPKQRSHWVKIAKRCNVEVVALRFTASASTCIERAMARAAKGEHDGELNNPDKVAGLIGIMKNRQKPIGKGERFDKIVEASEHDDAANVLVLPRRQHLEDLLLHRPPRLLDLAPEHLRDAAAAHVLERHVRQRARHVHGGDVRALPQDARAARRAEVRHLGHERAAHRMHV